MTESRQATASALAVSGTILVGSLWPHGVSTTASRHLGRQALLSQLPVSRTVRSCITCAADFGSLESTQKWIQLVNTGGRSYLPVK